MATIRLSQMLSQMLAVFTSLASKWPLLAGKLLSTAAAERSEDSDGGERGRMSQSQEERKAENEC